MIAALLAVVLVLLLGWLDEGNDEADESSPQVRQFRARHGRRAKW